MQMNAHYKYKLMFTINIPIGNLHKNHSALVNKEKISL
jgi:hypothetical protein